MSTVTHPPNEVLEGYRSRSLPPSALLDLDDHLVECEECRGRLVRETDVHAAAQLLSLPSAPGSAHATEQQLIGYVDHTLVQEERRVLRTHLERCGRCAREMEDLHTLRVRMGERAAGTAPAREPRAPVSRWRGPALLAGGLALGLVGFGAGLASVRSELEAHARRAAQFRRDRSQLSERARELQAKQERLAVVGEELRLLRAQGGDGKAPAPGGMLLKDGDQYILLESSGPKRVARTTPLPADAATALRGGRLRGPEILQQLGGTATETRATGGVGFRVLSPVGTLIRTPTPELRWEAVPGATAYEVTLRDLTENSPARSMSAASNALKLGPLAAGHAYAWEVRAMRDAEVLGVTPQAPEPEARFLLLPEADVRALARDLGRAGSPLARALLLARQGVLDDAELELTALERANPGSPAVRKVREALRSLRPAIPGTTPPRAP